jgi:hypothetical protein
MRPIYIGVGIALVVLVAAFLGFNRWQLHQVEQAYATPTPGPNASVKPIQLADGQSLGAAHFKVKYPDTAAGGRGQVVDGVSCGTMEYAGLHVHAHVAIFDNGKQIAVPQYIGFAPSPTAGCLYWIHTHDASGIIHVEAPDIHPPQGGPYTLGMLFDIWGQPLNSSGVAGVNGPVTVYVNGMRYDGDPRAIALSAHQQIVLEVGSAIPPPNYKFPPND